MNYRGWLLALAIGLLAGAIANDLRTGIIWGAGSGIVLVVICAWPTKPRPPRRPF